MGVLLDIRIWLVILAISALGTFTTLAYYYPVSYTHLRAHET